jgi:RimJ/RimL family protein N-acetyltransferase
MEPTPPKPGRPIINIIGDRIALGPPGPELLALVHRWSNDFEVRTLQGADPHPVSFEASKEKFDRSLRDETKATFCIYERSTLRPIGTTALEEIDRVHRAAEFDIRIGEKDCWGKGYGTETTRLMLDYGFTALGLHSIRLGVVSYNERAIRAYARAGFKLAGRIRQARRAGDRAYDLILMDCLATEFAGSMLHSLFPWAGDRRSAPE